MLLKPVKVAFMLWLHGNNSILRAAIFLALAGIPYELPYKFGGLISVCDKLEPAISQNNEILKINVLQKFTPHALFHNPECHTHKGHSHIRRISFNCIQHRVTKVVFRHEWN